MAATEFRTQWPCSTSRPVYTSAGLRSWATNTVSVYLRLYLRPLLASGDVTYAAAGHLHPGLLQLLAMIACVVWMPRGSCGRACEITSGAGRLLSVIGVSAVM